MIDMDTAIDYMYGLRAKNIRYSMDYSRTGADGTGDCSGTVYAALRKARGKQDTIRSVIIAGRISALKCAMRK